MSAPMTDERRPVVILTRRAETAHSEHARSRRDDDLDPTTMRRRMTLTVLVVEDDPAQRQMLRVSLEARGHAVACEVERGDDPKLRGHNADVAVVDLGLPGKSGIDVIRELRDARPDLPVLVLSASAHNAAITEALLAGALGYVVKGARLLDVVDAVELVAKKTQVLPARDNP